MSYKVLARTYRPQRFDALVGQEVVGRTLANAITRNRVHHAYLFCGPRGVGKTSAARILAMALNCETGPQANPCGTCNSCREIAAGHSLDVQEIDGASHNGVDHVRQLQETAYTRATKRCRIFIIDEVHMLTNQAFNALLKLLEEPPPSVHFIFATTEPHKVIDTIKSRCQRHDFKRIPTRRIIEQLETVCAREELSVEREALRVIAVAAEGGMRDALSLLEQVIAYTGDHADGAAAAACLGLVDRRAVMALLSSLGQQNRAAAMTQLDELYGSGADLRRFADALVAEIRGLVICAEVEQPDRLIDLDSESLLQLTDLAHSLDVVHLRRWLRIALDAAAEISRTGHPRTVLELAILRMADAAGAQALSQLLDHLNGSQGQRPSSSRPQPQAQRQTSASGSGRRELGLRPVQRPSRPTAATPPPGQSSPQQRQAPQQPKQVQQMEQRQAPPQSVEPEVSPTAPFLHAVARCSQPLAATLALAGIRMQGQKLVGRLDDARSAIIRQDRSKQDIATALAQHGFIELKIGSLTINASSSVPQPELAAPISSKGGAINQALHAPPAEKIELKANEPPSSHALILESKDQGSVDQESLAKHKPTNAVNGQTKLPALSDEAKALLALWTEIFPSLPDQLKGRLVPFAPIAVDDDTLILGSESEGLVEAVLEPLAALTIDHAQIHALRSQLVESSQALNLRSMLRQLRADRDPVFREQLALREHETTQAVVNLFGAVVDEVGL